MNIQELVGRLGENREVVIKKAVQCETAAELIELAENNKIKLTEQEAGQLLDLLRPRNDELSHSELDAVTGGSGGKGPQECPRCGSSNTYWHDHVEAWFCRDCDNIWPLP